MSAHRTVPVPEGLDGLRLDAAISRLFGLSRTAAAEIVTSGGASLDGKPAMKSDRVSAGETLDVDLPTPDTADVRPPQVVEGLTVLHEDDALRAVRAAALAAPAWGARVRPASPGPWPLPSCRHLRGELGLHDLDEGGTRVE